MIRSCWKKKKKVFSLLGSNFLSSSWSGPAWHFQITGVKSEWGSIETKLRKPIWSVCFEQPRSDETESSLKETSFHIKNTNCYKTLQKGKVRLQLNWNFQKMITGYESIADAFGTNSIQHGRHRNNNKAVDFTCNALKIGVVVTESHSQHILGGVRIAQHISWKH